MTDQNLREQVLQQVRAEIISGQSMPGSLYSVPSLAASLGVSTTPVREALLELTRNGLIEPIRNRGFKVVEPTLEELRNVFDLRELLELHAAAIVARLPQKDLRGLVALADDIARAVRTEDLKLYLQADRSFHRLFTAAAGNQRLTEMVMGLRDQMRLYGIKSRAGLERQSASTAEHYQIIELATTGDAEGLTKLLRHHIRAWEPIFVEALTRELRPRQLIVAGRSARVGGK